MIVVNISGPISKYSMHFLETLALAVAQACTAVILKKSGSEEHYKHCIVQLSEAIMLHRRNDLLLITVVPNRNKKVMCSAKTLRNDIATRLQGTAIPFTIVLLDTSASCKSASYGTSNDA